ALQISRPTPLTSETQSGNGNARRLPIGAEALEDGEGHFRVWAPRSQKVEVIIGCDVCAQAAVELNSETNGYFSGHSPLATPGYLQRYRLHRDELLVPLPASPFQPEGPLGPSMIIDPAQFLWHDLDWN